MCKNNHIHTWFDSKVYGKAKKFSIRIVGLYRFLIEKQEFVMSKQILRSGTSIGANLAESKYAQSTSDFISKLSIARKEASETEYWLDLLYQTDFITEEAFLSMNNNCCEIIRMLTSSIVTLMRGRGDNSNYSN